MNEFFLKIINMSISASWLVLVVLVLRFVLKKAPKWINVLLWGIVAIRLICPFSVASALSLIPSAETIPMNIDMNTVPSIDSGIYQINNIVNPIITQSNTPANGSGINQLQITMAILENIWILCAAALLIYTAISYWRLFSKVDTAVIYRDNIYQSENVRSPFVLGIIKPRVYLPFKMNGQDMEHVIAHELAHIQRKDHWWKPLGFLFLTIHWFNPLMWLGYILLCRDIELACDEKVIKELGTEQRADYTQTLVDCSVNHRMIAACPLAFGEVDVKERVKSVMNYKKPAFWIVILAVLSCIVVAVCFLTNPTDEKLHAPEPFCHSYRVEEILYDAPQYSFAYSLKTAPRYQFTSDYAMFLSGDILDDNDTMEWVQQYGRFEEVKITTQNFDNYFKIADSVSGWEISNATWSKFRESIKRAWRINPENSKNNVFYYLILTRSGDVYLTYGYDVDNSNDTVEEGSLIRWLFKLARTDILSCNAISKDRDAYIEPSYYPNGFDWKYENLTVGTINKTGTLVFTADWDTDTLVISEDYYRNYGDSTNIEKETYTLTKNSNGKFEFDVSLRGDRTEEAVYFILAETGVYVMKIVYGIDEVSLKDTSIFDLEQYRTDYIGDASKVSHIAQLLQYPKDYAYSSIELQTSTEPYELIVYLNGKGNAQPEDFENCSITAFNLIGNMGIISFRDAESEAMIASFNRKDYEENMKFYLTIGAEAVTYIELSMPDSSGGFQNADGSPLKKGERIWLENLDGYSDLRGLKITALNKDGEIIWSASIPNGEENRGFTHLTQDGWTITNIE